MRSKHVDFVTRMSADGIDDAFFLAIVEADGLPTQYLSLGQRSLTWGGQLYSATDGSFDTRRDSLEAGPPRSTVTFTNLSNEWYERLNRDGEEYNGAAVTFRLVFSSVDPGSFDEDYCLDDGPWTLTGGRLTDAGCAFNFGSAFDSLKLQVPVLLSRARRCQHLYKGKYCGYKGDLPTCDRSPSDCARHHGTVLRFSAWPFSNQRFF